MFALGQASALNMDPKKKEEHLNIAKNITQLCKAMYSRQPTGIAPEIISYQEKADYSIPSKSRHYLLRPGKFALPLLTFILKLTNISSIQKPLRVSLYCIGPLVIQSIRNGDGKCSNLSNAIVKQKLDTVVSGTSPRYPRHSMTISSLSSWRRR